MAKNKEYTLFEFEDEKQIDVFLATNVNAISSKCEEYIKSLQEKSSYSDINLVEWRVGNIEYLTSTIGFFKVGKKTTTKLEQLNSLKKFELIPHDFYLCVDCIFDFEKKLIAISNRSDLDLEKIINFLNTTEIAKEIGIAIRGCEDNKAFLKKLETATNIQKFSLKVDGSNMNLENYSKGAIELLSNLNGLKEKIEINGTDLSREVAIEIAKKVRSSEISVRIVLKEGDNPIVIKPTDEFIKKSFSIDQDKQTIIKELADCLNSSRVYFD